MWTCSADDLELAGAWIEDDDSARWRSATAHGPSTGAAGSGSSILEVGPGCRLPEHTDSAEEVIVVVAGAAEVMVEGERSRVEAPGLALVPQGAAHEVRNAGSGTLRFAAVYAGSDVVTRFREEVQPGGERERKPVA